MSELVIPLPPDLERGLQEAASREGLKVEEYVARALEVLVRPAEPAQPEPATKPFWQEFLDASETISDEDLAGVPADASANLDHYLYGSPKRS